MRRMRRNNSQSKLMSTEPNLIIKPAGFPLHSWMEGAMFVEAKGHDIVFFTHFSCLNLNWSH